MEIDVHIEANPPIITMNELSKLTGRSYQQIHNEIRLNNLDYSHLFREWEYLKKDGEMQYDPFGEPKKKILMQGIKVVIKNIKYEKFIQKCLILDNKKG